jgi:hypothetical protein
MLLGSLVDAGLPVGRLNRLIRDLLPGRARLKSRRVKRGHLAATKIDVILAGTERKIKNIRSIYRLIESGGLPEPVRQKSRAIFRKLAECEAIAHGSAPDEVSFDELGGIDTIVDIVGSVAGLEYLGIEEIHASAVNVGEGWHRSGHGNLPVPGPVTSLLLKDVPIYSNGIRRELTTPTGAAILSTLSKSFGSIPLFRPASTGLGAGDFIIPESPNVLRLLIGVRDDGFLQDEIFQIETHLDDLNPQIYEPLMEILFENGALDVSLTAILMKKGRPATGLTVLSPPESVSLLTETILRETTSLGVRIQRTLRRILKRENGTFQSSFGPVRIKNSFLGRESRSSVEFEDCKRLAKKSGIPVRDVLRRIEAEITLSGNKKAK